ncbi:universal stress protein [Hymenobacter rigui]|uniref:Universal stress protein n=1 Tax=Hymenobacter rigui TaxID=334424 RepID=A0A428KTW9_9BACT|nr:universal stress protein [Hymenobacter rigui]RSK50022.1 universal stress protein [Hymenobacter rigui]
MKTLLVPIDPATAEHTLAYANKLAVRWPAEIVLLYCPDDTATDQPPLAAAAHEQRLRTLAERLRYQQLTRQDGRRIRYHYRVLAGSLPQHLAAEVTRCAADLVVLGLPPTDARHPRLPGLEAATITSVVPCPVLVVPPGRRPLPNRLAFMADFASLGLHVLPRLSALQAAFPAPLDLLQFYAPAQRPQRRALKQALTRAASQLTWPAVATHLLEDDAPLEGSSEFCARTQAQLLIISPTSTAQLLAYFDHCYTTTRAYHTQIPVLVLRAPEYSASTACCARCAERLAQPAPRLRPDYHAVHWG